MTDFEQQAIFTENLNRILREKGLAQVDVYTAIDVSQQTFNKWVRGKAIPRMGKVQRLADFFGISKSELLDKQDLSLAKKAVKREMLMDAFDKLNEEGQEHIISYISFLTTQPQYKKSNQSNMVEEA